MTVPPLGTGMRSKRRQGVPTDEVPAPVPAPPGLQVAPGPTVKAVEPSGQTGHRANPDRRKAGRRKGRKCPWGRDRLALGFWGEEEGHLR